MSIFAICTTHEGGTDFDKDTILKSGIQIGDKIELNDAEVHGFHSVVYLDGYNTGFNSIYFDYVDENGKPYDLYNDESFFM